MFVKHFKGVVALANIRGGGEYGEVWHRAGMRENKQNVFDDFIAAAEFLISNNYTSSQKLAIYGASNGGLLVAACAQQRPDLYGAVIGSVGVLDMLRFHKFTIGATWIAEYGNPDDPEDFEFIYKYSPLHNIRFPKSGQWPSTLMMTADHDDRVVPCHTLKYAATLYEKAKMHPHQTNPLLFYVEENAGHGEGKPTWKTISELVRVFIFLQKVLKLEWFD
ncbi:peptidase, S9A/B/C family, catalytic domain protein [Ancylostoma duodenale]|uniref:Prolyl endopeptidase n=1 Tax=Ancylostoma duodenale TaxID=51022 RepID=A0A0C2DQW1_9BILA|nr:peptidase, S9A/B/C family, catalytic domain protein [Ancylostoma duodenale]